MQLGTWTPVDTIDSAIIVKGNENAYLIYNPYHRRIAKFNTDSFAKDKVADELDRIHFPTKNKDIKKGLFLTLSVSDRCGLGCVYCFTGEKSGQLASFESASESIINFFEREDLPKRPIISFFGSGDPFNNFDYIRKVVRLARDLGEAKGVEPRFLAQTSCVISQKVLDFIIENKIYVSASIDGPPDIQDLQRPLVNNKPTSKTVLKILDGLVESGIGFQLRSTVSASSSPRMSEMVDFWVNRGVKRICLEPLTLVGFGKDDPLRRPDGKEFAQNFLEAIEVGQEAKVNVDTGAMGKLRQGADRYHCAAVDGRNVTLAIDGRRTFCFEEMHPGSSGPLVPEGEEAYGVEPIRGPFEERTWPPSSCNSCYIRGACGSTCPKVAWEDDGGFESPYSWQCHVNRLLIPNGIGIIAQESTFPTNRTAPTADSTSLNIVQTTAKFPTLWG